MAKEKEKGWRKDVAPAGRAKSAQPAWKKNAPTTGPTTTRWSRKAKLFLGLASTGGVIGLIVIVILWLWPLKPAAVLPDFALYKDNDWLPPNTAGRNGVQRLVQITETAPGGWSLFGSGALRLQQEPKQLTTRDLSWDEALRDVKEKTVIAVLALHGGVDEHGAYLLADDLTPGDARNRLRLKEIIDRFDASDLADKHKVLLLDATQLTANWQFGLLHNDFARELHKLNDRIQAIPNFVVMSASGPDQCSWVSEEWQTSVFLHLVAEGLRGGAKPEGGNRISALHLFDYVQGGVKNWVQTNRDMLQTPVLLPADEAGRERANNIYLVEAAQFTPADARQSPGYSLNLPPDFAGRWERADALAKQKPHPAAYSPHLYRQYLDKLLRYEQLIRMGDAGSAAEEAGRIDRLEREIVKAREVRLDSLANALALPTMLGLSGPWADGDLALRFNDQWDAKEKKWDEVREWAAKAAGGLDHQRACLFQVKMNRLLLEKALKDPVRDNLAKAREAMEKIEDANITRPVESHLMLIFDRDAVKTPAVSEGLELALRTRRLAEQAALGIRPTDTGSDSTAVYSYSELVYLWTRKKVEDADQSRRLGEDRMLAADAKTWLVARQALEKARDDYREALRIAAAVQAALNTRDEVMAALPYYARWAAGQRAAEDGQDARITALERLWADVHDLDRALADPPNPDNANALDTRARNVRERFEKEQIAFNERCLKLSKETAVQQKSWHAINDVLSVPFIEPSLRVSLLQELRRVSRSLLVEENLTRTPPVTPDRNAEMARLAAKWQGQMALATLGRLGFEAVKGGPERENVDNFLRVRVQETNWWHSMGAAGRQLGQLWHKLPERIRELVDEAGKAPLDKAEANLAQAERLARLLDGPSSAALPRELFDEGRKIRLHDLLLWLADRTWRDHYRFDIDDDPNAAVYYQSAGDLLVTDARKMIEREGLSAAQRQKRQQAVTAMSDRLKPPRIGLTFPAPARPSDPNQKRLAITSERAIDIRYRIDAPAEVLPGFPVLWLDGSAERLVIDSFGQEKPQTSFTPSFPFNNDFADKDERKPLDAPKRDPGSVGLTAVFRGQRLRRATTLEFHRLPEWVLYQHPRPNGSRVSVRADDAIYDRYAASNSGIVFVLDCSYSMHEKDANGQPRFERAKTALARILPEIPKGTKVSIWAFAHEHPDAQGKHELVERAVQQLQGPTAWEGKDKNDPQRLAQVARVMNEINKLKPFSLTPVARATVMASADLNGIGGFKTLIVITDGMDTRFVPGHNGPGGIYEGIVSIDKYNCTGDPDFNPTGKLTIEDFLVQRFPKKRGIEVHVIRFDLNENEKRLAKGQFEEGLKKIGGKSHDAQSVGDLIQRLRDAMQQRMRYSVLSSSGAEIQDLPEGYDVSKGAVGLLWSPPIKSGSYTLRVKTDEDLRQRVELDAEAFPVKVTDKGFFQRVLFADDFPDRPDRKVAQRWLLAALQNQFDKQRGSLQMLVTAEKEMDDQAVSTLRQVRPQFVWLELEAREARTPFAVRWGGLAGIPAPAFSIDVPRWPMQPGGDAPAPALPRLHAYLAADREPRIARIFHRNAPDGYANLRDLANREEPIEGDPVTIESVEFEDRLIETSPGERKPVPCLVVRIRHAPKKPVFVQIDPSPVDRGGGYEHRFYTEADKYTGVFWPISKGEAEDIRSLRILAVDDLKKTKGTIQIDLDLRPPDSVRRPEPFDLEPKAK